MAFLVGAILILLTFWLLDRYFMNYWSRLGFVQWKPKFLVGDMGKVFLLNTSMAEFFQSAYENTKKHPIVGLYFSYRPVLLINDPQLICDILVRDFSSFHDRPLHVDEESKPMTGDISSVSGSKWRDLRVKMSKVFTSGAIKSLFPAIQDKGHVLAEFLERNINAELSKFDLEDLLSRQSINIVSSVGFGIDIDCINDPKHAFNKVSAKINGKSLKHTAVGIGWLYIPEIFNYISLDMTDPEVDNFFISTAMQIIEEREKNKSSRKDFMQLMVELKNEGFASSDQTSLLKKLTCSEIAAQMFQFFGSDSSRTTMFFCLLELAKNPKLQRKAQEEIDEVLAASSLTYVTLNKLNYLNCCIAESLRKYPTGPVLMRRCTKDYKVRQSVQIIPKGAAVYISLFGLHRDPEFFEHPLEFKPERFLDCAYGKDLSKEPFYLPFGAGPRTCIGKQLGIKIAQIGLAILLSKFNFEIDDKTLIDKEIKVSPSQFIVLPSEKIMFNISLR